MTRQAILSPYRQADMAGHLSNISKYLFGVSGFGCRLFPDFTTLIIYIYIFLPLHIPIFHSLYLFTSYGLSFAPVHINNSWLVRGQINPHEAFIRCTVYLSADILIVYR